MNRLKRLGKNGSRLLTVVLLIALTFGFAMFQGGFVSWFIFFTVIPFFLYSLALGLVPLHFDAIERIVTPSYIQRGDHATVTVRFRNRSWFPIIFVIAQEAHIPETFYRSMHVAPSKLFLVGWRRHFEWTYEVRNTMRGEHTLPSLQFTVADFFGWIERTFEVEGATHFVVYPKATEMKNTSLHLQYEQGATATKFSMMKDTTMATGVREYRPGDRFSWIHWKSFAKNGDLRTKEFEDRQSQKLYVLLDRAKQPLFEGAVDLTASIVTSLIKSSAELSFITGDNKQGSFAHLRTAQQADKVLHYLAGVEERPTYDVLTLLRQEVQIQGGVLLLVTSNVREELMALLMSGSKYAKAIICFVVVTKEQMRDVSSLRQPTGDNRIVYVTTEMFAHAFAEVNKG